MKQIISIACVVSFLFITITSCNKSDSQHKKPYFRVHNFSPGSPAVYMTLDGWQNTGSPIGYLAYGGFGEYPYDNDGNQELKVWSQTSGATYLKKNVELKDYYTYSIFVSNLFTSMDYLVIPVYKDPATDYNKCKIRFVNLCPNAGAVKVIQGTDTLFINIAYLSASDYIEIASGTKITQILSASNTTLILDRGHFYNGLEVKDIVLSGFLNATDTTFQPKLTVVKE